MTKSGKKTSKKPIFYSKEYSFFENVWAVVRLIPRGKVTTYGAIARYLGTGKAARTVGYAMNAAHTQSPPVPAHRVVNRQGLLTGKNHFSDPEMMQKLLETEGIEVKANQIVDFEGHFWDPSENLSY